MLFSLRIASLEIEVSRCGVYIALPWAVERFWWWGGRE